MRRGLSWVTEAVEGQLFRALGATADDAVELDLALVVTDSREVLPGSTYIARVGETADGHDFAQSAVDRGAVALIVERQLPDVLVDQIVVGDATQALGRLAKAHLAALRQEGPIEVVGITGSAGKTTTKDLLGRVLSAFGPTVWPKMSFNNEVGCPITVLGTDGSTRYLVLEMGASGKGELSYLTNIAPLDVGVVLMVGRAHLGGFGGVEGLARAKAELVEGILPGGTAVLNLDDPAVVKMERYAPGETCWFSAVGDSSATIWAQDVAFDDQGRASFQACIGAMRLPVKLGLIGSHQVSNALAAMAVASVLGVDMERVAQLVSGLGPGSPHRMDVRTVALPLDEGVAQVRLIDDSYNANPDSMKAAFQTARTIAGDGRLLMVLGEMLELGKERDQIHREVGEFAKQSAPDALVLIGGADAYMQQGEGQDLGSIQVLRVADADEAITLLKGAVIAGDTILVKGSNGSGSWKVADGLIEMSQLAGEAETA